MTQQETISDNISRLLTTNYGVDAADIHDKAFLKDELYLDSLEFTEVVVDLEKEYNISVSGYEMGKIETFGDLVRAVDDRIVPRK